MTPAASKRPKFFYGYIVLIAASFVMMVTFGVLLSFGVFFKPLSSEFGWTREITSGAYSICLLLWGVLGIVVGRLNDRFGPRLVVTVCGFILGLGYLLMSQVNTIWQLYLFYGFIVGTGMSGSWVPLVSTTARWFVKRRGLMTGIVVSGESVGVIIMAPVITWLILAYGWRTSYLIIGIIIAVVVIIAAQFLRREPGHSGQLPDDEKELRQEPVVSESRRLSFREAIRGGQFWVLSIISFGIGISIDAIIVHIIPHATDLGVSTISAAGILSIISGVSIAGRIGMGAVSDRIGSKLALIICLLTLSVALFWLLVAKELWMFYIFAVIFGFGFGGSIAMFSPIVATLYNLSSHGIMLGVVLFVATIGGAISPLIAGRVFDMTGSYFLAFLGFAVLCTITLILTSILKMPHKSN